jgi:hypothetical protein
MVIRGNLATMSKPIVISKLETAASNRLQQSIVSPACEMSEEYSHFLAESTSDGMSPPTVCFTRNKMDMSLLASLAL